MEFHFLELPKLRRRNAGSRTGLDRMLSYLGNVGGERAMQEMARTDSRVERMMQLESLFTKDPTLLRDYFIARRDRADYENSFRQARTDGFAEGRAAGMEAGMEAGVEKTAVAMLKENVDILLVSRVTGFSTERLKELQARSDS